MAEVEQDLTDLPSLDALAGMPTGGATGTILTKKTEQNYDTAWTAVTRAEPPSIALRVGANQVISTVNGTFYRPDMSVYVDPSGPLANNQTFFTAITGGGNTRVQVLQDGTYAISASLKISQAPAAPYTLLLSQYLSWTGAGRRVLAHSGVPSGVWESAVSAVTRLNAGVFLDVQIEALSTGTATVYRDSLTGGLVSDAGNFTVVKL